MSALDSEVKTAVFSALADPSRRAILERLRKGGEVSVGELAAPLEMSLPAVSKHLKILERAGLLDRRRQGRNSLMSLNPGPLKEVVEWLRYYEQFWTESFESLDLLLAETAPKSDDEEN